MLAGQAGKSQIMSMKIYALIKKKNQKELDPKFFDANERIAFNKSDAEEWKQWLHNRSVRLATPQEEQRVPKSKIISAPMRYVRTNRGRTSLEAKSRIIIPGHLDPQLGSYRTDSPTTSWLAVLTMISVALCNGMMGSVFDVKTAFLSGLHSTEKCTFVPLLMGCLPQMDML